MRDREQLSQMGGKWKEMKKERKYEGKEWGVGGGWGIHNLKLSDGIKELVMQESLIGSRTD